MKIIEIFESIQGEGQSVGQRSIFIRLAGCDLKCSWCDTKYSWTDGKEMSVEQIMKQIKKYNCEVITITGGEPLLQQKELYELLINLTKYYIYIETSGTIKVDNDLLYTIDFWNVSPKENADFKLHTDSLDMIFKFVVQDEKDLVFVKDFIKKHNISDKSVYLMPKAINRNEYLQNAKEVWTLCLQNNFNFSPREQIVVYDKQRGI